MRLSIILTIFLLGNMSLSAQKAEVKHEITQSFASYKSSFENANNCMKVVYECFQSAMSVDNAQQFALEAKEYAGLATKFAEGAAEDAAQAELLAESSNCPGAESRLSDAQAVFFDAKDDFYAVKKNLGKAAEAEELEEITDLLVEVMEIVQVGIKKLNEGAAKINDGMKGVSNCD